MSGVIHPPSSMGCPATPTDRALRALAAATGDLATATAALAASTARIEALLAIPPPPPLPPPRIGRRRIPAAARAAALAFAAEPGPGSASAWTGPCTGDADAARAAVAGASDRRPPITVPVGPEIAIDPPPPWIAVTDPRTLPPSAGRDAIYAALAAVTRRPVAAALAELAPEPVDAAADTDELPAAR